MKSGVILLDKPLGISSQKAIAKIKHQLKDLWQCRAKQVKIGHAGTLDPLATGLLVVCIGSATKLSSYLMHGQKTYGFDLCLGAQTTTDDAEGEIIEQSDLKPSLEQLENAIKAFVGKIDQIPPQFSAIKIQGKKMYEYARKGQVQQVDPRSIDIESIKLHGYEYPKATLEVTCSKGTYIRSLARDIGLKLKCYAHAQNIRRLKSGQANIEQAHTLEDILKQEDPMTLAQSPIPMIEAQHYILNDDELLVKLLQGQLIEAKNFIISVSNAKESKPNLLLDSNKGTVIAILELINKNKQKLIKVKKLLDIDYLKN